MESKIIKNYTINMKDLLLAALSGIMLTASFAPINLDWIAWISLIPLLMSLENKSRSDVFKLGFFTGLFHYLTLIYWVTTVLSRYGNINIFLSLSALLLLSVYLSLYIALFAFCTVYVRHNRLPSFLGACIWVSLEYARSYIMTGFPWCLLGYSQYSRLPLIQISDITGVYGISFVIVLVNFVIYNIVSQIFLKKRLTNNLRIETIFTCFILGCILIYGYSHLKEAADNNSKGKKIRAVVVQGNIDPSVKWDSNFQEETVSIYKKLSLESAHFEPHIIIWPETALPYFFQDISHLSKEVFEVAKITNAYMLFGSPAYLRDKDTIFYYNRAYMISSNRIFDYYDKVHLVPFGEYVPLKKYIPFVHRLVPAAGDFSSGKKIKPMDSPGLKIGALICFETIFPDISRKLAAKGAELLVNLTNDAWFGHTSAPYQHLCMAVFRCVENGVPMIRAANTGLSAFILANGKIIEKSNLFMREVLQKEIKVTHRKTFYSQLGNIFAILTAVLTLINLLFLCKRR